MKTSYNKTNWVDNKTPVNAENLNNIERGISNLYSNSLSLSDLVNGSGIKISLPDSESDSVTISLNLRKVYNPPLSDSDSGEVGDYFIDKTNGYLYFCINSGGGSGNFVFNPVSDPNDDNENVSGSEGGDDEIQDRGTINWIKIKLETF